MMVEIHNGKDILNLRNGDKIRKNDLYEIIVKSKDDTSDSFLKDYIINNTPQQGINWIGNDEQPKAVIIKSKSGKYENDSNTEYAFKARNGKVNKFEKANKVIINQKKYKYPIMYFFESGNNWILKGRFSIKEEKNESVVLEPFDSNQIIGKEDTTEMKQNVFVNSGVTEYISER